MNCILGIGNNEGLDDNLTQQLFARILREEEYQEYFAVGCESIKRKTSLY